MEKEGKNTRQENPLTPTPATYQEVATEKAGFSAFFPMNPTHQSLFYKNRTKKNPSLNSDRSVLDIRRFPLKLCETGYVDQTCGPELERP
jgi:hypothetical protein